MNARTFGRDVAPLGHWSGAMGFARGAPLLPGNDDLLISRIFSYRLPGPKSPEFDFAILVRV